MLSIVTLNLVVTAINIAVASFEALKSASKRNNITTTSSSSPRSAPSTPNPDHSMTENYSKSTSSTSPPP
jgi:hypothetical protein